MATRKQKAVVQKILENPGISTRKAAKAVGYSDGMADNPQDITQSKGFQVEFRKVFSDEVLNKAHAELLNAKALAHMPFPYKLKDDQIKTIIESTPGCIFMGTKRFMTQCTAFFFAPDFVARKHAIDMAYKVIGNYAPERVKVDNDLPITDEELDAAIESHQTTADRFRSFKKTKKNHKV